MTEERLEDNPILIEITRGDRVESVHRGALAIANAAGELVFTLGEAQRVVYPRSSLKPIQALSWLETGAAEAFGVSDEEIALACASHAGEPMHTERIAAWLERMSCSVSDLACGPHEVVHQPTALAMIRAGEKPTHLHNNCSGKHTGFLTAARHLKVPISGYEHAHHPVQRKVEATLRELAELSGELPYGIDGCAAPNFAVPLTALARAMAKLADANGLTGSRAQAARRIVGAMKANPDLIAGTNRPDTIMTREAEGGTIVKTGAEGVYIAILPKRGLGVALKIDDGATRAAQSTIAALLMALDAAPRAGAIASIARTPVKNTRGVVVGERRPAEALARLNFTGGN